MTRTPCAADPAAWDTYREDGEQRRRANRQELAAAINACHSCPQFLDCAALPPPHEMVQAGVIYTSEANPIEIRRFLHEPDEPAACADMKGRRAGYRRHLDAGEPPCGPCERREKASRAEYRRRVARQKPQVCSKGHPYTRATVRLDSVGRRICLTCRPDCAPNLPPVQMACKRAGHDWSDPRNVARHSSGRYCLECKRIDRRARSQARREARAARTGNAGTVAA